MKAQDSGLEKLALKEAETDALESVY